MGRDSVSLREHDYGVRIAVLEERWKGAEKREDDYRATIEKRLTDLNGEAGRLKNILDNSVPLTTFNAYISAQRDRADALERADRAHFDAYVASRPLVRRSITARNRMRSRCMRMIWPNGAHPSTCVWPVGLAEQRSRWLS